MISRTRFTAIPIDMAEDPVIPRIAKLAGGIPQNEALGLYVRAQGMGMKFAPDGDFSGFDAEDFAAGVGWQGDAETLFRAFLEGRAFVREGERLTLHRWTESGGRIVARLDSEAARKREKRQADKHSEAVESTPGGMSAGHPQDGRRTGARRAHLDRDVDVDLDQDEEVSPEVKPIPPPAENDRRDRGEPRRGGEAPDLRHVEGGEEERGEGFQGRGERLSTPEPDRTARPSPPLPVSPGEANWRAMLAAQGMTPAHVKEGDRSREVNIAGILAGRKWHLDPEETADLTRWALVQYPNARPMNMQFLRRVLSQWRASKGGRSTLPASRIGAVSGP